MVIEKPPDINLSANNLGRTNGLQFNSYRKNFSTNFFASIISNFPCNNGLIQSNGLISIPLFLQRPKSFTPVFQSASP
ncbi:MAG: hypothetical protein IJE60_08755, partial [Tyzzerella sp.]|nr:hypothetical protein [Tyzzerella sp.]